MSAKTRRTALVTVMAAFIGLTGAATATAETTASTYCAPASTDWQTYAASLPQVRPGDKNPTVVALQLNLRQRGHALEGTGDYQANTLAAVRAFQRAHGINDSGIVGPKTWHALLQGYSTRRAWTPGEGAHRQMLPGSHDVAMVQDLWIMMERVHPYDNIRGNETTHYGPKWQHLVRDFQRRAGINASGIVGPRTWAALEQVILVSGRWGC
ncbi:peptidoglycan-binding domain-containing protein [Actinokineospora globicatena]|uniref:Peptidoglycan binding-like domain-containing protein n=1 Tax=Actinokineospora globicatena TaxID=103729 RepID=A0A9W6QTF5_9PSEU|nr:peptidoglycan-binding protein [Actinokineospora globicatena]GLW94267.1 hypothetical protein Aglo03_50830 [Actinokineospora globicatena]